VTDENNLTSITDSTQQKSGGRPIADRRIYGTDAYGRTVLVAAAGQPIPEGFEQAAPTQDHARRGPESSHAETAAPRKRRSRSATK
jgi:hypothetical protein